MTEPSVAEVRRGLERLRGRTQKRLQTYRRLADSMPDARWQQMVEAVLADEGRQVARLSAAVRGVEQQEGTTAAGRESKHRHRPVALLLLLWLWQRRRSA